MAILLDIFSVIAALVVVLYAYCKWSYQYWKRKNAPYLEPTIPFGNFGNPFEPKMSISEVVLQVYQQTRARGWKYSGVYSLASPVFVVADLDLAKNVMTKDFNHFVDRGAYVNEKDDPLGCHLFAIGGKKWKNLRIKLTPTFTSGKLKAMFETLTDCGLILEKYIQECFQNKKAIDIKEVFGLFTTDIIGSCAFGLECNSFKEPDSLFRHYGKKFFEVTNIRNLLFALVTSFPSFGKLIGFRTVEKDIADFFTKVVEDTVAHREKNNSTRKDFLQLLIDIKNNNDQRSGYNGDGKTLTMVEIAAQCLIFFIAGFETSSTTATFSLYELATHQDIQDKVREEINTVLARHDNKITYDSLNEMTYLKQVIDEALRKYPPLAFVTRMCVEDYKVPGENLIIEKDTQVVIPIVGFHYDKEYYENPSEFDPERFTEENKKTRHPYAHIPFGEGPRMCIGERFGIMQTKVGLTSILKNFKVTLNENTKMPLALSKKAFITTAEGGVWLNIEKI